MKKPDKTRKRLLKEAHEMAKSLHRVGALDMQTMKEFDVFCLSDIEKFSSAEIKSIRKKEKISQPILARIMNVSLAAVRQWERGERSPSGAALKLLNLIAHKGIQIIY